MARCGCGGGACTCYLAVGDGLSLSGSGSIANPYLIGLDDIDCAQVRPCISAGDGLSYNSATGVMTLRPSTDAGNIVEIGGDGGAYATVDCADVRPCLSGGDGITYDPVTGLIQTKLSTDAGNNAVIGGDGGVFVPAGGATVITGCGLTGDGSGGAPLSVAVGAWDYPCSLEDEGGRVFCDANGVLRSEPRGVTSFVQDQQILNPANLAVPAPQDTQVATHVLNIPNPDPCRDAFVMIEGEVDADFNLPAGSGAALGISTDEMSYVFNNGGTTVNDVHIQGTKVVNATIPAGGNLVFNLSITMGRGSGGATYNRVQSFVRAFVFVL